MSLYWYNGEPNFGDALSPLVCARYLGQTDLSWARARKATVAGIGSILDTMMLHRPCPFPKSVLTPVRGLLSRSFRRPLNVWGSGLICRTSGAAGYVVLRKVRAFAVRGRRMLDELVSLGALVNLRDDIAFGDPALLTPQLMPVARTRRHRLGFVPHVAMFGDGTASAFAREHPEYRLIDPRLPPSDVITDIVSCEEVFSCSLHGLILADAYGVPNHWVGWTHPWMSDADNAFKYLDYYSAVGESREPFRLSEPQTWKASSPIDGAKLDVVRGRLTDAAAALTKRTEELA